MKRAVEVIVLMLFAVAVGVGSYVILLVGWEAASGAVAEWAPWRP